MSKGRHRKPNNNNIKRMAIGASVVVGGVSVPLTFAGSANAATVDQWDRIAECESNGLWNRPDGDGGASSGGLQFQPASWSDALGYLRANGVDVSGYPQGPGHQAYKATKQQQIIAGEALLALQGPGAWTCNAKVGSPLSSQGDSMFLGGPNPYPAAPPADNPPPAADPAPPADNQEDESEAAAEAVLALVNVERAKVGAAALVLDAALNDYAYAHARTQAHEERMFHSDLDFEGSPRGENVAVGQTSPEAVVAAWMASPGHKANILGEDYTKLGVGLHDDGEPYWAQVFAGGVTAPAPDPDPTVPPVEPPDAEDGTYTVKPGDYLAKIAADLKIEGGWQALYEINKAVIGPNPNLIEPGMKLALPGHEAPATDPYADGLPKAHEDDPSAKPLQEELKRVGYLADDMELADVYGPKTRAAVAHFHDEHREYRTVWRGPDVQIGLNGWAHLQEMSDDSAGPKRDKGKGHDKGKGKGHWDHGDDDPNPPADPPPAPDPDPPAPSADFVLPVHGRVGQSLIIGNGGSMSRSAGGHSGLDISAPSGTPVVAATAGEVVDVNGNAGPAYGNYVTLKHAGGIYTLHAHLSAVSVSVGQSVTAGQQIGNVGSTGNSSGPHLHFEVRTHPTDFRSDIFLNPVTWLRSNGVSL